MSQPMEAPWIIIESYFKNHHLQRLVRHHIESYNALINSYMGTRLKEQFISREMAEGLVDRGVEKFVDLGLDALQIKAEKFKNKKKKNKTKQAIKNMRENMPYTIIKSGISGLTKQMASYYGKYNIRVNFYLNITC